MNAMPHVEEICRRVVAAYRRAYGDDIEAIYLYGSYARGDFDEESDIDFAAIVKGDQFELRKKRKQLLHEIAEMDMEYDVFTSPKVISADLFKKYKTESGYYKNILKEGIRLA